jgi:hypothetical protein
MRGLSLENPILVLYFLQIFDDNSHTNLLTSSYRATVPKYLSELVFNQFALNYLGKSQLKI